MPSLKRVFPPSISPKKVLQTSLLVLSLQFAGLFACAPLTSSSAEQAADSTLESTDAIDDVGVDDIEVVGDTGDDDPAIAQTTPDSDDAHFLWSVDTPTNTVYLLGSIHILSEDDYPLPGVIQAAFEDAEKVVFEVDLDALDEQETLMLVTEKAAPDSEDERLQAALTPEIQVLAEAAAAEVNLPLSAFYETEPWFFSVNLVVLKLMQLGFSGEYGIDRYLFQQAVETEKEIIGLETLAEQLDIFDTLSVETQQTFVEQTISELDTLETSFNEMRTAWHEGDVEAMEALATLDPEIYPELHDKLLTERNLSWVEDIKPMLADSDDYLIVVGAAHMLGETGLVQQLEGLGYTVEQQ